MPHAAGDVGLIAVQKSTVTRMQLGENSTDWLRQQTFKGWDIRWWSAKDSVWYKICFCFYDCLARVYAGIDLTCTTGLPDLLQFSESLFKFIKVETSLLCLPGSTFTIFSSPKFYLSSWNIDPYFTCIELSLKCKIWLRQLLKFCYSVSAYLAIQSTVLSY